ncbi:hypothetical protein IHN63_00095 [Deinococcus sp. 6YEL10]|uniref:hypothetical protein n=1 Tax=Deinococcus sp. 6YEL10 TaxID=2745870 RepID=UPI001E4D140D|nr:hypothetical protein [Deinococcus sp. 6YEL10]MCD0159698.1 hypothetical protein [Deinococcus sp. 6YEL10]
MTTEERLKELLRHYGKFTPEQQVQQLLMHGVTFEGAGGELARLAAQIDGEGEARPLHGPVSGAALRIEGGCHGDSDQSVVWAEAPSAQVALTVAARYQEWQWESGFTVDRLIGELRSHGVTAPLRLRQLGYVTGVTAHVVLVQVSTAPI